MFQKFRNLGIVQKPLKLINEIKSVKEGGGVFIKSYISDKANHWGVDLAIGQQVQNGQKAIRSDGGHGHVYMYMNSNPNGSVPAMLFGVESPAAYHPKHSKLGNSSVASPSGCSKFEKLGEKLNNNIGDTIYKNVRIPKKYNGMVLTIDDDIASNLMAKTLPLATEIAILIPAENFI